MISEMVCFESGKKNVSSRKCLKIKIDYKGNFKWILHHPCKDRHQCPVYNGSLKSVFWLCIKYQNLKFWLLIIFNCFKSKVIIRFVHEGNYGNNSFYSSKLPDYNYLNVNPKEQSIYQIKQTSFELHTRL